jgi:hypothetical protein|tara:strand:+ start:281 stop:565 length:285 start_codon:yes stop_codon:yes gene_type:complete
MKNLDIIKKSNTSFSAPAYDCYEVSLTQDGDCLEYEILDTIKKTENLVRKICKQYDNIKIQTKDVEMSIYDNILYLEDIEDVALRMSCLEVRGE